MKAVTMTYVQDDQVASGNEHEGPAWGNPDGLNWGLATSRSRREKVTTCQCYSCFSGEPKSISDDTKRKCAGGSWHLHKDCWNNSMKCKLYQVLLNT